MLTPDWQLKTPLDAIIFDCDGTLSWVEGIDELASMNGVAGAVKQLTEQAMGQTGVTRELYRERLLLTQPRAEQMALLAAQYIQTATEDSKAVVSIFKRLEKKLYILSAGLLPAILPFARHLGIPDSNVHAVDIRFDEKGSYLDYDRNAPLTENQGKRLIVGQLRQQLSRVGYVGDGLNDCPVQPLVTRFVGYGGACYRKSIASLCRYYIKMPSFAPLLALFLTQEERDLLTVSEARLWQKGLEALETGEVEIRQEKLS